MASTSAPRGGGSDGATTRIRTAATTLFGEHQSLIVEMRKAVVLMKDIAVDLEKCNDSGRVKELESAVAELLRGCEDCALHASAIESVGGGYQPGTELTDFKKLLDNEYNKLKPSSSFSGSQNHGLMRQFREAVWNVHHAGQPMPGDEQEEIVMTSSQTTLLNNTCPLSGKPVTELTEPVCGVECKHIYEKAAVMHHIGANRGQAKCPVAGCPRILKAGKVACDPLLAAEIEEIRLMNQQAGHTNVVEDFTSLDEEEGNL